MEEILHYWGRIKKETRKILVRGGIMIAVVLALNLFRSISIFMKYGYSRNGSLHHSFMDYPNEIDSKDALELSNFMKGLNTLWNSDQRIYRPTTQGGVHSDRQFGIMEVDVKDPIKRNTVIYQIAQERGIPINNLEKLPIFEKTPTVETANARLPRISAVKGGIAFPPDYLKLKKPPRPFATECNPTQMTEIKSTVISFSPEKFSSTNLRVDGMFSYGGKIRLRKATAAEHVLKNHDNITINITLSAQSEDLFNHISLGEADDINLASKDIHISSHHPTLQKSCLVVDIEVVFPATLQSYKNMKIKANHASRVEGDLGNLHFNRFTVGVGKGVIAFKKLNAERIMLGAIHGFVTGSYEATQTFDAAVIKGANFIDIKPQSKFLKSTVVALDGPVKATVRNEKGTPSYGCRFIAHCWLCKPNATSTNSNHNIRIYSKRRSSIMMGYYKEWSTTHQINVHSKYGDSELVFL